MDIDQHFVKDDIINEDVYRKISASSTTSSDRSSAVTLIAPNELQKLLEDVRQLPIDYGGNLSEDIRVISFYPEFEEQEVGLTLDGGSESETKDITVRKII